MTVLDVFSWLPAKEISTEELEQSRREAQMELDRVQEMAGSQEVTGEELTGRSVLETFDKDRLKALIEKVVVYGEDAIENVWKVRNPFDSEVYDLVFIIVK